MGREVRRVPKNWVHPRDARGRFIPLFRESFETAAAEWDERAKMWEAGMRPDFEGGWVPHDDVDKTMSFQDYAGHRPEQDEYMPDWPSTDRTHYQMYETCSEGTPISPVMADPEDLAHWLADTKASMFGLFPATFDKWLEIIERDLVEKKKNQ